ncbi:YheT family hydrolase [Anditalea andensis]|uniref:Alpha/beta hydrolase n=1 Tax=Anditalea andensis TaxID=1048983 RepID=A0A074KVU7_9BACT|nr:alpha/beta fold hydrolase [Anditalea andensis]KEO71723.1 alpha/beta hydrolase [Anditalea andensis]
MPIILNSSYSGPPPHLFNGHWETIVPSLFRKVEGVKYERERIYTPDEDFLDLDWSRQGFSKLLIISHGLEGSSQRHYVLGLVKLFNRYGYDVLAWNNRSCSGEMNTTPRLYHHGSSDDLQLVIDNVLKLNYYNSIFLSGISMGGAQTLKYLGENALSIPKEIKAAAVYSTPCNLPSSAATLKLRTNAFYKKRFLGKLKIKLASKVNQFPDLLDLTILEKIKDFDAFDNLITAPLHGFKDAVDFYASVSADNWLAAISIPTLIVNALNDPLLGEACYPKTLAADHEYLYLEMPARGGHTGFTLKGQKYTWAETRLLEFLNNDDQIW